MTGCCPNRVHRGGTHPPFSYQSRINQGRVPNFPLLSNAILALCRAKKSRIGDEFQIVIYGRRASGWKLPVPDYALDMHTSRGRSKGRRQEHFFSEGTKLTNSSVEVENPYTQEAIDIRTKGIKEIPQSKQETRHSLFPEK